MLSRNLSPSKECGFRIIPCAPEFLLSTDSKYIMTSDLFFVSFLISFLLPFGRIRPPQCVLPNVFWAREPCSLWRFSLTPKRKVPVSVETSTRRAYCSGEVIIIAGVAATGVDSGVRQYYRYVKEYTWVTLLSVSLVCFILAPQDCWAWLRWMNSIRYPLSSNIDIFQWRFLAIQPISSVACVRLAKYRLPNPTDGSKSESRHLVDWIVWAHHL